MSYSDGMDVIVGAFPPIARGARSRLIGKRPYSLSVSGHGDPGAVRKFSVRPKSRFQPTRLQATDSYGGQGTGLQIYIGGKPQLPVNTDSLHASGPRLYNIVPAGLEIVFEVTYFSECDWSAVISGSVFDVESDFVRGVEPWKAVSTATITSTPTGPREIPVEKAKYVSIEPTAEKRAYDAAMAGRVVPTSTAPTTIDKAIRSVVPDLPEKHYGIVKAVGAGLLGLGAVYLGWKVIR